MGNASYECRPCCNGDRAPTLVSSVDDALPKYAPTAPPDDQVLIPTSANQAHEQDQLLVHHRLKTIFRQCDRDGSGDLSLPEIIQCFRVDSALALEYGYRPLLQADSDEEVAKFFAIMDKDKNMKVTWEEFESVVVAVAMKNRPVRRPRLDRQDLKTPDFRIHSNHSPDHDGAELLRSQHVAAPTSKVNVQSFTIDYWSLTNEQSLSLVHQALKGYGCLAEVPVPRLNLQRLFDGLMRVYRKNPYHNFEHALATMHYTFRIMLCANVIGFMHKLDLFSAVVAGICHDIDHRGRNTGFEIATLSEVALRYGDDSPLERHHVAQAFELAFAGGAGGPCNIYTNLSKDDFTRVRKCITEAILGTDMTNHNEHVECAKSQKSTKAEAEGGGKYLVSLFLHMADIGNPLMPTDISFRWSHAVIEEFTAQVREEKSLGIPVTAMMDNLNTPTAIGKNQLGFINFVVSPLVKPLVVLYKGMTQLAQNLEDNRAKWSIEAGSESKNYRSSVA